MTVKIKKKVLKFKEFNICKSTLYKSYLRKDRFKI